MKITDVRARRVRVGLEPPFRAAWDPEPRRAFEATLVSIETDEGITGVGSGDTMDGFEAYEEHFLGMVMRMGEGLTHAGTQALMADPGPPGIERTCGEPSLALLAEAEARRHVLNLLQVEMRVSRAAGDVSHAAERI